MTIEYDSKIKKQFNEMILRSQNIGCSDQLTLGHIDEIFDRWENAKRDLCYLFTQGELIYTFPEQIEFIGEPRESREIDSFIFWVSDSLGEVEAASYLDLNKDGFYANQCMYSKWKDWEIPRGMKLFKSLKFFVTDPNHLRQIQDRASQIQQQYKVKGYLSLSIHPLDYLTISESASGWGSCHSLQGDYRAGNLSYMLDNCTMVCYLSSGKPENIYSQNFTTSFPWNSKIWRTLLHVSEDKGVFFLNKEYPFNSPGLREKMREVFLKNTDPWSSKMYNEIMDSTTDSVRKTSPFFKIKDNVFSKRFIVKNHPGSLNYNDILHSPTYHNIYHTHRTYYSLSDPTVTLGASTPCVNCGDELSEESSFFCRDCMHDGFYDHDTYCICDSCGDLTYRDYSTVADWGDTTVCEYCFDHDGWVCEKCGNYFFNELPERTEQGDYYCKECAECVGA